LNTELRKKLLAAGQATGEQLADLMRAASELRDAAWGRRVTYSRKVFIPLTNLCRDTCGYCTFAKTPDQPGAGYLTPDDVVDIVKRGQQLGCKEALFSLGERPEARYPEARAMLQRLGYKTTLEYVVAMCASVLETSSLIPHVNAGTLTLDELADIRSVAGSVGLMLENVSRRLVQKGMAHYACPDKVPAQRLRTLERAGQLNVPTTSGILIGIGETWEERVDSLIALGEIHKRHGHLQEVIVQNFRAKPGTLMMHAPEPDMDDMLRTIAAARLVLPPDVSLQAPPNLSEDFERYLDAGINDWGGISPVTADHINPERAWPALAEILRRCAERGMQLTERLTTYPRFLQERATYLAPRLSTAMERLARADGLAKVQTDLTIAALA